jgi:hypothetical protein
MEMRSPQSPTKSARDPRITIPMVIAVSGGSWMTTTQTMKPTPSAVDSPDIDRRLYMSAFDDFTMAIDS